MSPSSTKLATSLLSLTGLFVAALATPLLQMINASPDFYTIYDFDKGQVVIFVIGLCLALPLGIAITTVAIRRWLVPRVPVELLVVYPLFLLVVLRLLRGMPDLTGGWIITGAAIVMAGVLTGIYLRVDIVRQLLACLVLYIPVLATQSLVGSGFFSTANERDQREPTIELGSSVDGTQLPNILVLVFDELPTVTLLDTSGNISRERFPAFRALADTSYWFPQASTVACNTTMSIPAILTGRLPEESAKSATFANYPNNFFTLFSATHNVDGWEPITGLCPASICTKPGSAGRAPFPVVHLLEHLGAALGHATVHGGLRSYLPDLDAYWIDAAAYGGGQKQPIQPGVNPNAREYDLRMRKFDALLDSISREETSWATFAHVLFPHLPFNYLSSGHHYFKGGSSYAIKDKQWTDDEEHVYQSYYRHVEQSIYTDELLGRIIAKLHEIDLFDETIIVVAADHGVNHHPESFRRRTNSENLAQMVGVPLIIKTPHQRQGVVSDARVRTIDILPTLLDIIGFENVDEMDGNSVLSREDRDRAEGPVLCAGVYSTYPTDLRAGLEKEVIFMASLLGSPDEREVALGFRPRADWMGHAVTDLGKVIQTDDVARIRGLAAEGDTPTENFTPAHINGHATLANVEDGTNVLIVIELNGRVASVMPTVAHGAVRVISSMLDLEQLREGENHMEIFWAPLGSEPADLMSSELDAEGSFERQTEGEALFRRMKIRSSPRRKVAHGIDFEYPGR